MTLDLAMRQAMQKCIESGGRVVEITYTLGDIPWKITVEINDDKLTVPGDGK